MQGGSIVTRLVFLGYTNIDVAWFVTNVIRDNLNYCYEHVFISNTSTALLNHTYKLIHLNIVPSGTADKIGMIHLNISSN